MLPRTTFHPLGTGGAWGVILAPNPKAQEDLGGGGAECVKQTDLYRTMVLNLFGSQNPVRLICSQLGLIIQGFADPLKAFRGRHIPQPLAAVASYCPLCLL